MDKPKLERRLEELRQAAIIAREATEFREIVEGERNAEAVKIYDQACASALALFSAHESTESKEGVRERSKFKGPGTEVSRFTVGIPVNAEVTAFLRIRHGLQPSCDDLPVSPAGITDIIVDFKLAGATFPFTQEVVHRPDVDETAQFPYGSGFAASIPPSRERVDQMLQELTSSLAMIMDASETPPVISLDFPI